MTIKRSSKAVKSASQSVLKSIGRTILSPRKKTASAIEEPSQFDILCGKDKNFNKHPGNKIFREMIDTTVIAYKKATTKQEKMKLTREVVIALKKNYGSRFLKKVKLNGNFVWDEISDQLARDKVSHAIRFVVAHPRPTTATSISPVEMAPSSTIEIDTKSFTTVFDASAYPQDTAMDAIIMRQQALLSNIQYPDDIFPQNELARRHEDLLDSVRSEDIREYLLEPMLSERSATKSVEFDSLRSEDINQILTEPIAAQEWEEFMRG